MVTDDKKGLMFGGGGGWGNWISLSSCKQSDTPLVLVQVLKTQKASLVTLIFIIAWWLEYFAIGKILKTSSKAHTMFS